MALLRPSSPKLSFVTLCHGRWGTSRLVFFADQLSYFFPVKMAGSLGHSPLGHFGAIVPCHMGTSQCAWLLQAARSATPRSGTKRTLSRMELSGTYQDLDCPSPDFYAGFGALNRGSPIKSARLAASQAYTEELATGLDSAQRSIRGRGSRKLHSGMGWGAGEAMQE
jgi:hypothetical protein